MGTWVQTFVGRHWNRGQESRVLAFHPFSRTRGYPLSCETFLWREDESVDVST